MSYILDALRKAEKDRNLGRTPSLGDVTAPVARPASRKPSTREFALMGLVLGLLLLTVLLWPRRPAQVAATGGPLMEPAGGASQVGLAMPAATVESSPAGRVSQHELNVAESDNDSEAPAPGTDESAVEEGVEAESIDDLLDESGQPVAGGVPDEAADQGEDDAPAVQVPVGKTGTPAAVTAAAPAAPAALAVPAAPVLASPGEPTAAEPPSADSGAVLLLRDMPSDYRASFPELRIDVHVYDADPARRWALVNGKKQVEGSTLPEGPTVSAITPDGIVFDYRGKNSLYPLNKR